MGGGTPGVPTSNSCLEICCGPLGGLFAHCLEHWFLGSVPKYQGKTQISPKAQLR